MDFILAAVLFIIAVIFYMKYDSSNSKTKEIPGPKGLPFIGSALQIKHHIIHEQFGDFARQYGPIFELQMLGSKLIVLNSIEFIHNAFYRDGQIFNDRPGSFLAEHINLKESIVFRNADKGHQYARRSFVKGLRAYDNGVHVVKGEIDGMIRQIEGFDGQAFEVNGCINRSLINVVSILLIGEAASDEIAGHFTEITKRAELFVNPFHATVLTHFPFLLRLPFYKGQMDKVVYAKQKLVDKYFYGSKESSKSTNLRGLIDWYFHDKDENSEASTVLTDDMIKASLLNDVFLAGVGTTAGVIPSIILCLVNHPEYQTKLHEEIDRVIGNEREPTIDDRQNCPFVEAVTMESMRYITPVPFLVPHVCSEDTVFEGYHVKAKTQVFGNAWFIHHDENIWGDPWTFRPERFLDDSGQLLPNTHQYMKSYIPFGIARRQCAGMAMATTRIFLYVTSIFQRLTLVPSPGKCGSCDPRKGEFIFNLLFKPKPFLCIAKRRI